MDEFTYEPEFHYLDEIYLSQIVVDDTENISVFAYLLDAKTVRLKKWSFFCQLSQLTDILISLDDKGDRIIQELSTLLSTDYDIPTIVGIEDILHESLLVDKFVFKVYVPHELNEHGDWVPSSDNCLFIEDVELRTDFIKRNNGLQYISCIKNGKIMKDLLDEALNNLTKVSCTKQLYAYLEIFDSSFKIYKSLFIKGFSEKKARKNSGLEDELLFQISLANHKSINN